MPPFATCTVIAPAGTARGGAALTSRLLTRETSAADDEPNPEDIRMVRPRGRIARLNADDVSVGWTRLRLIEWTTVVPALTIRACSGATSIRPLC